MANPPLPKITEPDENIVHYTAPNITGNVTLCGLTDFIGHKKPGKATKAAVTCHPCQAIVKYIHDHAEPK
jgi:hypothetical protein